MVLHAAAQKLPHRLFLFYSNRRPEDAPFLDELQALQRDNPHYTFVGTMTAPDKSSRPWQGETGFITPAMLSKVLMNVTLPIFYVVGPPGMVTGLRATRYWDAERLRTGAVAIIGNVSYTGNSPA